MFCPSVLLLLRFFSLTAPPERCAVLVSTRRVVHEWQAHSYDDDKVPNIGGETEGLLKTD